MNSDFLATNANFSAVLTFAGVFFWQVLISGIIFYFRVEFRQILLRMAAIKISGIELTLQESAPDLRPSPEVAAKVGSVLVGKFLSPEGIPDVVRLSGVPGSDEPVLRSLLIFATDRQRTWLIATKSKLMCLLDDEGTRASGSIVQWVLGKAEAVPVAARPSKSTAGAISIGPRSSWLYSTRLFSSTDEIEKAVRELVACTR